MMSLLLSCSRALGAVSACELVDASLGEGGAEGGFKEPSEDDGECFDGRDMVNYCLLSSRSEWASKKNRKNRENNKSFARSFSSFG